MTDKNSVCLQFVNKNKLSQKQITSDTDAIYWLENSTNLIADSILNRHIDRLTIEQPTWGLFNQMLNRVFEYVSSSLIIYCLGQISSAEVIARTAVEGSVNILYILNGNRVERLWQYFNYYINNEKLQNKKWIESISYEPESVRRKHQVGIDQKEKVLGMYTEFIDSMLASLGVTNPGQTWPNIFERFKEIGKEISYRTTYAAMSSQTHNDAEDLLNKFFILSSENKELIENLRKENINFSRMLVYIGLQYYLEACLKFAIAFDLVDIIEELARGYKVILSHLQDISTEIGPFAKPSDINSN